MDALPIAREPRFLGRTSLAVFPIAYGCWRLVGGDAAVARRRLEAALELGIELLAVAGALARLREAGKVREVGVSNFTTAQFAALRRFLPFPIATHQPELSCVAVGALADGLLDQCLAERVTPLAWSPLAGGRLGLTAAQAAAAGAAGARLAAVIRVLDALAEREKLSRSAIALAWLLVHPAGVIPIVGTRSEERLRECVAALDAKLTRDDWYAVWAAARGEPIP